MTCLLPRCLSLELEVEKNVDETDEGRRRGSGANDVTRASQPVRNRLSAHEKYGARGDDEE